VIRSDNIHGHKADVVTVLRVFRARIAEAYDQFHAAYLTHAALQR
jgi:hypothetical protein